MTKIKRLKPEYAEALLLYATTTEPLKSITNRLRLRYNTVSNYMRRNCPVIVAQHKALFPKDEKRFDKGVALLQSTDLSPYQVKKQLGYGSGFINFIRTNHPELQRRSTHYNVPKNKVAKTAKYAEAVEMLTEMKDRQCNVIRKIAESTGLNYHALRKHIYTYHRELIGLGRRRIRVNAAPVPP